MRDAHGARRVHRVSTTDESKPSETPDEITIKSLAAEAGCDPRTIKKRLRGERVAGLAGARADRVLAARRLAPRNVA